MSRPSSCLSRFVWWELFTPDIPASAAFYEAVVGWRISAVEVGGRECSVIQVGEQRIGNMTPLSSVARQGAPPFWIGHISIADADAAAVAARDAGGQVLLGPVDVPPVGRFVVLSDPQGAAVTAFKSFQGDPPEVDHPRPGMVCWSELLTTDIAGAGAFYETVLGWKLSGQARMVFLRGDRPAGGVQQAPPGIPSNWLNHVAVADLAKARNKVVESGGKVLLEEVAVPGLGRYGVAQDNVGAVIALFQS